MAKEKRGLFEKLGLVEKVTPEDDSYDEDGEYDGAYEDSEPEVDASLETVNVDTLINDIYAENGLSDRSKSIYMVEKTINSLPAEMTTAIKKTTVLSLLGTYGLVITNIVEDGNTRLEVLNKILNDITSESDSLIEDYEVQIESLKEEIAAKEKLIAEENERKNKSNDIITGEIQTVTKLIKFIEEE